MSFLPKFITEKRPWEFCPHQSYGWLGWTQHAVKFIALCLAFLSWAQFIADNGTSTYFSFHFSIFVFPYSLAALWSPEAKSRPNALLKLCCLA
jgi:hypothetical protein